MAMIAMLCLGAASTAKAVTWTAGEIVQAIQQAQASGQPFDRLLAQKVQEELAKANFQIIDNQLVYSTTLPSTYTDLSQTLSQTTTAAVRALQNYLLLNTSLGFSISLGRCEVPIPEGSLSAARSTDAPVSAKFSNTGTVVDLKTNPNQVVLGLAVDAELRANTRFGLDWCGIVVWPVSCQVWVQNPLCPPCPPKGPCPSCPLPDVCVLPGLPTIARETWTDWAPVDVFGQLKAKVSLALNHSLTVADNTITVGLNAVLDGSATDVPFVVLGPVDPDFRLINIPIPPFWIPHVNKAPLFQTLGTQVDGIMLLAKATGYDDDLINRLVFKKLVEREQDRLNTIVAATFPIRVQLPTIADFSNLDPASQALVKFVLDYLRDNLGVIGEFVLTVVKQHWTEVLYYILTDNRAALGQLFAYEAVCPTLSQLRTSMPVRPLFGTATGVCAAIDPRAPGTGPYYADASCQGAIGFQTEDFNRFCREAFTATPNPLLGNAAAWPSLGLETDPLSTAAYPSTKWSLSSAAQLSVGVESIRQNNVPYMKRVNFRQVGSCALEMRVFKKDISATNVTPLLWIHGGSWALRGGFLGLESLVSSYTEENFVVFAPFYRLVGDKDGNQECRNAGWQDLTSDVEAALDWVKANAAAFGAVGVVKVAVIGQSAGGHLAGWLMTHRPNDVSRGMLVYPPTDVGDFLSRLQGFGGASFPPLSDGANTPYNPRTAQAILETAFQLPKDGALAVNLNAPPPFVTENSYPGKVRLNAAGFPPAFILHGTRDSLLSYTQSQVLCEGYGGVVNLNWAATPDLRAVFPCGSPSQLHLFREADHAFEICLSSAIPSTCRAGSAASAALLADSLGQGRHWLIPPPSPGVPASITVPFQSDSLGRYAIAWGPASGEVTRYELYEARSGSVPPDFSTAVLRYSGTSLSVSLGITSNSNSGTYYYRVRACNSIRCGDYRNGGNGVYVSIEPPPPPPPPPCALCVQK
jgi:acetyl esterase/lipase